MSILFTGDKQALRRTSNMPTAFNDFTICFCFKLNAASTARNAHLVYAQNGSGSHAETMYLTDVAGTALVGGDSYGANVTSTVGTVSAGGASGTNWNFSAIVGTAAGAGGLKAAFKPVGSGSLVTQTTTNSPGTDPFSAIQFGDVPFGSTYWFDGYLAHLKIYDRALSDAELLAEAGAGAPVDSTDLISYHSFSNADISVAVVPDTGTGTFGYQTSAPSTSTDMPVFSAAPTLTLTDTLPKELSATIPSAPTLSTATVNSSRSITVTYTSPGGVITGYRAYAQKSGDGPILIGEAADGVLSITGSGLTPNTAYTIWVTAYNTSGQSSPSNTLSRTTYKLKVSVPKVQKSIYGESGVKMMVFTSPAPGERIGQKMAETTTLTINAPVFDVTEGDSVCEVEGDISAVFNEYVLTATNGQEAFVILDKEASNLTTGVRPATVVEEA